MIKKFFISIGVLFSFFLMFLLGFDKINVLAINNFDSSIGSYNFTIDIDNYNKENLIFIENNSITYHGLSASSNVLNNSVSISGIANDDTAFSLIGSQGVFSDRRYFQNYIISSDNAFLLKPGTYIFTYESNYSVDTYIGNSGNTFASGTRVYKDIPFTIDDYKMFFAFKYIPNGTDISFVLNDFILVEGDTLPDTFSNYFKFGYNITGNLSILSTSSTSRDFTLRLCNKLARYDGDGFLIDGTPNCFHVISQTINSTGLINIPINSFLPFDISDDGTISFDMEFSVGYSGNYYSDLYLCPYTTYDYNCSGNKSSLIFTPVLQGYYKGKSSNNIIHSKMNFVSNNFYYKGFYLYGRGSYFNDFTNSYNYFDTKEFINFISNDVKTGANLGLNSSLNEETWSINTNVASDYIKSTSYYNSININEFFNYSIDMSKFFEHNSHFTQGTATGDATINDYTMFWGFSSINTRVLDSNSSTTPIPGDSDLLNKYNTCSAWYDIPCQLGNAITYVIYEAPIISPVLTFIVSFITMFSSLVSFVDLFRSFGIVFGCFIIYMFIELLHKYSK